MFYPHDEHRLVASRSYVCLQSRVLDPCCALLVVDAAQILSTGCNSCLATVSQQGRHISLEVNPAGEVTAVQVDPPSSNGNSASMYGNGQRRLTLAQPGPWTAWALSEDQFAPGVVGAKAYNLAKLRRALPNWIQVPASVAIPFWSFERVLWDYNRHVGERVKALQDELGRAQVNEHCSV